MLITVWRIHKLITLLAPTRSPALQYCLGSTGGSGSEHTLRTNSVQVGFGQVVAQGREEVAGQLKRWGGHEDELICCTWVIVILVAAEGRGAYMPSNGEVWLDVHFKLQNEQSYPEAATKSP